MKDPAVNSLIVLVSLLATACWAEQGILVVQVNDIQNRPVEGVEIAAKGASEPGATGRTGLARLKLDIKCIGKSKIS